MKDFRNKGMRLAGSDSLVVVVTPMQKFCAARVLGELRPLPQMGVSDIRVPPMFLFKRITEGRAAKLRRSQMAGSMVSKGFRKVTAKSPPACFARQADESQSFSEVS